MLSRQELEDIYTVAEKIKKDMKLTEEEQDVYDDILEDSEYYDAFCLYMTLFDLPMLYEETASCKELDYTKQELIEKYLEIENDL